MRKGTGVATVNRDDVLQRIRAGERLTDIARSLGLKDHSAISHRLRDDPDYLIARETGVEARMEARESELEVAADSVTVARARELLSHARWRAEREFPERWGQHKILHVDNNDDLGDRLRRAKQRLEREEKVVSEVVKQDLPQSVSDKSEDNQ